MAVQDGYGKSSGSESLVFAYDLKDTVNSYKGEPTVNLTTDTPLLSGWQGTFTLVDTTSKTFIIETRQDNAATTSAWRTYYWNVSSYVGLFITISANVKFVSETNCNFRDFHIGQGNTGSFPLHIAGSSAQDKVSTSIKPVSKTFMTWSGVVNATGIVGFTQWIHNVTANGGNSFLEVSNIQIESKSHATPFINGTRSSTQGLLDLTGNNIVNLSNLSFDSNAQMVFDGTGDYADVSVTELFQPQNTTDGFTVEFIYRPEANTPVVTVGNLDSTNGWFQAPVSTSSPGAYLYFNTPGVVLSTGDSYVINSGIVGKYQHIVMVLKWSDTANSFIMVNGEDKTVSKTAASKYTVDGSANPGLRIGKRGSSIWPANGQIPLIKIYNRALTSTEVVNNYLKYKRQYGLT